MVFRIFLFLLLIISFFADGQLSLKNPSICHDKEDYLKCYNDGTYILNFEKGIFKEFTTTDSAVKYSNLEKTITIYKKLSGTDTEIDSLQIILLPRSILLKKGNVESEIKNFKEEVNPEIKDFFTKYYYNHWSYNFSINYNYPRGLSFYINDKDFNINVDIFNKKWAWNIFMDRPRQRFSIYYNGYFKNRLESISIQDDSLRYGMSVLAEALKSKNKIWDLESLYVDSVGYDSHNQVPIIGGIHLDKKYEYIYYKNGKLNRKKSIGEMKLCD